MAGDNKAMKYFKDAEGNPWEYDDGVPESQMRPGLVAMTPKEVEAYLNPPPPPITTDDLKEIVTRYRWEVETGGITLPGGIKVATALDDQNRITTVVANARLAGLAQVKFKAASGWATLAVAEVEGIAAAIALHVQACFAAECAHHEAIDDIASIEDPAERQAALDEYDETQGWPA
jgi:hypothetical protein